MTTTELLRSRLIAITWVQRRLSVSATDCARELSTLLQGSGEREVASLSSRQTFEWLDTMVRLIDRNAPMLMPEGQFAAHAAAVVNLAAGLSDNTVVTVRFDEFGVADLPALGVRVDGGFGVAGCSVSVNLDAPDPTTKITSLTESTRPATDPITPIAAAVEPKTCDVQSVSHVIERWTAEGRALASDRIRPSAAVADGTLADLLTAASVPTTVDGNYGSTEEIRSDSSFDHLSLLSVRAPAKFAAIASAAADGPGRLAKRIVGHTHYIGRRYADAADAYAELLLDDVEDLDLWRDYCWAMRHDGFERGTRCWVMHPVEVSSVARAVAFDDPSDRPREVVARFLEWVSDDFR